MSSLQSPNLRTRRIVISWPAIVLITIHPRSSRCAARGWRVERTRRRRTIRPSSRRGCSTRRRSGIRTWRRGSVRTRSWRIVALAAAACCGTSRPGWCSVAYVCAAPSGRPRSGCEGVKVTHAGAATVWCACACVPGWGA